MTAKEEPICLHKGYGFFLKKGKYGNHNNKNVLSLGLGTRQKVKDLKIYPNEL
jgi:hypothetical protein